MLTPAVKYWACKTAPALVYEAMECLGGNGYVEENPLPRLYREAPVNAIWEGSGNVMCLDVLRALASEPALMSAVLDAVRRETQSLPGASATAMFIQEAFSGKEPEAKARLAVLASSLCWLLRLPCANVRRRLPKYSRARGCMSRMEACWERASSGPTKPGSCSTWALPVG